jgi:TolA-binding protein
MRPSGGFLSLLGLTGFAAWMAAGLLTPAASLMAQKREDFIALQRDVAQLQDQLKQMETDQNQKLAALQTLIQQALDASQKVNAGMASLQDNLKSSMAEQQNRTAAPLANLNNKVNQVSEDVGTIKENVADVENRLSKLDTRLADISTAVRTLSTPPPAPPTQTAAQSPTGPAVPAGVTAESLYQNAFRDYSSGKDDLAMQEFTDYLKYFPQSESAPAALYYQGMIYDRAKPPQYDDAIQAFDAVVERYPENQKTPEAQYMKAVDLMKAGRKTDAGAEFRDFLKTYPNHPNAGKAQAHLRELGLTATPARGKKK